MLDKNQLERVQKQMPVMWAYFWVCLSALFTWDEGKDVEFSTEVKPGSPELSHGGLWKLLNADQRNQPKHGELPRVEQNTCLATYSLFQDPCSDFIQEISEQYC